MRGAAGVMNSSSLRVPSLRNTGGTVQLYYQRAGTILVSAPSGAKYRPKGRVLTIYASDLEHVKGLKDETGAPLFSESAPMVATVLAMPRPTPLIDALAAGKLESELAKSELAKSELAKSKPEDSTPEVAEPFDFSTLSGIGPARSRALAGAGIGTAPQFRAMADDELAVLLSTTVESVQEWKAALPQ
jgi:predicted flap endonuclease-1-like 5' DNA nuclease